LPELSESAIQQLDYHEAIRDILLVLHQGVQTTGPGMQAGKHVTVTGQLLAYIHDRRPRLWWSQRLERWGFAGLTIALPVGYGVFLHPKYVQPTPEGAAIVAHELGHALWNSHGFDSSEEEYYCDRVAGRAYQEVLVATGAPAEEAARKAQARFSALVEPLAVWAGRRRQHIRRHLLQPWTWFDNSRAADIASNILLGPWVNLGVWGYPVWRTRRDLGK
jgi:hypothetical protein